VSVGPKLPRIVAVAVALSLVGSTISARVAAPEARASGTYAVLVGAGDIGRCDLRTDESTAAILGRIEGTVFTTGDNVYPNGTASQFANCYGPSWGKHLSRTRPSPGNHDYHTAGASGYFDYFGARAGPPGRGYYAYNRGSWRIYSLNSEMLTDRQLDWLRADLAANPRRCSMAYWHRPLYSSGPHGNYAPVRAFWRALQAAGAELIVNGHEHTYERFAIQLPGGTRSLKGIRQFVVGTAGAPLRPFETPKRNSVVRNSTDHGVLRLILRDGTYSWDFVTVRRSIRDSGSARCHA
jgi:hypothetical protein